MMSVTQPLKTLAGEVAPGRLAISIEVVPMLFPDEAAEPFPIK
jgi:hypothetical protein